jgi:predicted PurR-regulated permease PerM
MRTRPRASSSQQRSIVRDLLIVAAIAAGIWLMHRLERIVLVLILAMFFAYVVAPLVDLAQRPVRVSGRRRCLPRAAAIAVVYLAIASTAAAAAAFLWPRAAQQLHSAIVNGPTYVESLRRWEHGWTRYYERLRIPIELRHSIDQAVLGAGDAALGYARGSLSTLIAVVSDIPWLVLVPVFAFLLLKDAAGMRRTLIMGLPHRFQLAGHRLFEELNRTFASYIRAQLIASVVIGTVCGLGFALLGSPYAILLGVLAAVLEFIPLVGPLLVAVVAIVMAALHAPLFACWTAAFLGVVRIVEDYVIYPRLIGRAIRLQPLAVILAVLTGAELGGIAGMFIAVPSLALMTVVWRHARGWNDPSAVARQTSPAEPLP